MFYLNGNYLSNQDNAINVADRGFLLGDGVFTTLKAENSYLIHFEQHLLRLKHDASQIYININLDVDELHNICMKLLQENNLDKTGAILRITITRGSGSRGINISETNKPTILIIAVPHTDILPQFPRVCITNIQRNKNSILTKIKSLNYLESIMARHEAVNLGYDDGLMINTNGCITSCSVANIFFITQNSKIVTPPISEGVLPGIVRGHVLSICTELNISITEIPISTNELKNYRAAFITNCVIGIRIIKSVDDILFTCKHELIEQIRKAYNVIC